MKPCCAARSRRLNTRPLGGLPKGACPIRSKLKWIVPLLIIAGPSILYLWPVPRNEIGYERMSKAQLVGRYYCVIEKFTAPTPTTPVMIIESDNDPLVELTLREQLKATYPDATVHTFSGAGHFPYLNRAREYTRLLVDFLSKP